MTGPRIDYSNIEALRANIPAARANRTRRTEPLQAAMDIPVAEIREISIEETGHHSPVRLFIPEGAGPFPVLFFMHAGGFIMGSNDMDIPTSRFLCREVGCVVVSPDYVLAPEHPWPDGIEEIYAIISHFAAHPQEYRIDPQRIAIGGCSAGANFAAACCILASQRKEFAIKLAALVYPVLDFSADPAEKTTPLTDSMITPQMFKAMDALYVVDPKNRTAPTVSPALGAPEDFPPLCIFSARRDLLFKETLAFVNKLMDANREVLFKLYPAVDHGFLERNEPAAIAQDCKNIIATQLKKAFTP